jgi:hypothetical protein
LWLRVEPNLIPAGRERAIGKQKRDPSEVPLTTISLYDKAAFLG